MHECLSAVKKKLTNFPSSIDLLNTSVSWVFVSFTLFMTLDFHLWLQLYLWLQSFISFMTSIFIFIYNFNLFMTLIIHLWLQSFIYDTSLSIITVFIWRHQSFIYDIRFFLCMTPIFYSWYRYLFVRLYKMWHKAKKWIGERTAFYLWYQLFICDFSLLFTTQVFLVMTSRLLFITSVIY